MFSRNEATIGEHKSRGDVDPAASPLNPSLAPFFVAKSGRTRPILHPRYSGVLRELAEDFGRD